MKRHRINRPPASSGHIKGWRLWLCLGVLLTTLLLLQQARKLERSVFHQRWLITLDAPLTAEEQALFEQQLSELPALDGRAITLQKMTAATAATE